MHSEPSPLGEFDVIERFFKTVSTSNDALTLGIGDDCALLKPSPGEEIAITSDMLVEGRHFFADTDPEKLGRKALAVNLSDLAAMGAKPLGFTLAIALPRVDAKWLEGFSRGLLEVANQYGCPLIGGDTTAGPLTLSITALGTIPVGKAISRSGAKIGDDVWVSGTLGDARLTLAALHHEIALSDPELKIVEHRMHEPTPRIELGIQLRDLAHAALDISDGLLGDLMHILKQSKFSAEIWLDALPKSLVLQKQSLAIQNQFAASGGDDYEICFTAPVEQSKAILEIGKNLNLPLTRIGKITPQENSISTIALLNEYGKILDASETAVLLKSFDHFAN